MNPSQRMDLVVVLFLVTAMLLLVGLVVLALLTSLRRRGRRRDQPGSAGSGPEPLDAWREAGRRAVPYPHGQERNDGER